MTKKSKIDQIDFEIQFFERLLTKKQDFIEVLEVLADLYTKRGDIEKGLALDERLKQFKPQDPIVYYNLACSYSLLKEIDKALDTIKQAVDLGYDNLNYLAVDPDLSNLRQDARFQNYLNHLNRHPEQSRDI